MMISASVTVDRPVDQVFALMADVRNEPHWNSQMTSSALVTPEPIGLGSRFETTRRGQLNPAEITEFVEGEAVTFEVDAGRLAITGRMAFAAEDSGTRLDATFDLRSSGPMRVMLPLMAPLLRRDFPRQLARFKEWAEQGA